MRMCLSAHLRRVSYARAHAMLGKNTRGYWTKAMWTSSQTLAVLEMRRVKIQLDTALRVIRYAYVFVFVHVLQVAVRATLERHVF